MIRLLIVVTVLLLAPLTQSQSHELLVRNPLPEPRPGCWVTVTLTELGLPADPTWRSVTVRDEAGTFIPAQLDRMDPATGFSSEILMRLDLAPLAERRLLLQLSTDSPTDGERCTVRPDGDSLLVQTPAALYPVSRYRDTLRVEQPRPGSTESRREAAVEDMLDELLDAPTAPATTIGVKPKLDPPMRDDGLPFCIQGLNRFTSNARLISWNGSLRASIALVDEIILGEGKARIMQRFWFPVDGREIHLDAAIQVLEAIPKGRFTFGAIQLNSKDFPWTAHFGQDSGPPLTAPVQLAIRAIGKQPYLEGYQRSSFNHLFATLAGSPGWIATLLDRRTSRLGLTTHWGTGRILLDSRLNYDDPGPHAPTLAHVLDHPDLPAGFTGSLRALFPFGTETEAAMPDSLPRSFQHPPAILPIQPLPHPTPDAQTLRHLIDTRRVLIAVPDHEPDERRKLWDRLAAATGGMWRRSAGILHFINTVHGGKVPTGMLIIVVGSPGCGGLFDQMNQSHQVLNPYPLTDARRMLALIDGQPAADPDEAGALLIAATNRQAHLPDLVETLLGQLGERPPRPPITLSQQSWADKMPAPWEGLSDTPSPFRALAWRRGHAEYLLLLRANQPLRHLELAAPPDATTRFITWTYEAAEGPRVVPLHDAAVPEPPDLLEANHQLGIWITLPIPADAPVGLQRHEATLTWDGGSRDLLFETEILAPILPDKPVLGFYPMGMHKQEVCRYFHWDLETYYARLPDLLRQRRDFHASTYTLDMRTIRLHLDDDGNLSADTSEFRRELDAVRQSGAIDTLFIDNPKFFERENKSVIAELIRHHQLPDDFAAWEYIIPVIHAEMEELGLAGSIVCRYADEIDDYERWLAYARLYARCGFRMSVAINGYGVFNKHQGVGTMGFWIPLYNFYLNRWGNSIPDDDPEHFSRHFRDARQAAGEPVWPYVCGPGPYAWSARPRSQARFLALDTYMKGADGLSYYGGTVWSHALDPFYRDKLVPDLRGIDATFTTLFYPDAAHHRLLPSLRAAAFRLGFEDAAATEAVRRLAEAAGRADDIESRLQSLFATLTMDAPQAVFDDYRRSLSALALSLQP